MRFCRFMANTGVTLERLIASWSIQTRVCGE